MGGIEELKFGPYRAVAGIGRGGMGEVYEAEHSELGIRVAVKVIEQRRSTDPSAQQRFEREARALKRIVHPNVVAIHDATFAPPRSFIVMELLRGETLAARLRREGRLSLGCAIAWFLPMISGVRAIHAAAIIHRDLKLSNVMLVERARGVEPVILDLGVSRFLGETEDDSSLTHTNGVLGTTRYLSPEQTLNVRAASPRSDQYALGLMLYECLTGTHPFSGTSPYEIMHAIVNSSLPRASTRALGLPEACDAVLARAMHRDPMQRYPSVADFGAALLPLADAETSRRWAREFHIECDADGSVPEDCTEVDSRRPARFHAATSALRAEPAQPRSRKRTLVVGSVALLGAAIGVIAQLRNAPVPGVELPAPVPSTGAPEPPLGAPAAGSATAPAAPLDAVPPARVVERDATASRQPAASAVTERRASPAPSARPSTSARAPGRASSASPVPGKDDPIDPFH